MPNPSLKLTRYGRLCKPGLRYARSQWSRAVRYVNCGLLTPHNNAAENAIRPVALGRKNWLFAGVPNGAGASAMLFSLVETAKANEKP